MCGVPVPIQVPRSGVKLMRRGTSDTSATKRLLAVVTSFSIVLIAASWATAQSENPAREKLKKKVMEKIKQSRDEQPSPPKKTPARPVSRSSDVANPLAAAIKPSEIDAILNKELQDAGRELSPVVKDEDFLRRVTIDLTGKPPTPDKLDEFVESTDPDKRLKVIDELLDSDDTARNWARYWRDVISYHAINQQFARAGGVSKNFEDWMTDQFKQNVHWDKIATELITAKGDVQEDGRTFLIFAQNENNTPNLPVNLASEATRVFMGIQIACAQCHDHPYDEWKREQFHEVAAFFARTIVTRMDPNDPRSFVVKATDDFRPGGAPPKAVAKIGGRFPREHQMPDKEDSEKKHTMHPQFLLGQTPAQSLPDVERRAMFAQYVTDKSDPWFARAYVNRIWSELMGEGFYEPVDDLGPGRTVRFPTAINRLASAWRASDYDVKWLFRLVMNTEAYQREIRPRDPSAESTPFASVCPTRLSGDQIFDSLMSAFGIEEAALGRFVMAASPQARRFGPGGPRLSVTAVFGVDPSTPIDDVQGTVPQALFMMNNQLITGQVRAQGDTLLGRLLSVYDNDEELVRLLYKRVLARVPTDQEMKTCHEHIKDVNNRHEAFEDLLWSLVNSTEFITKR